MRNPAKCYLVDAGIARKVTSEDRGRLLENLVYLQFRRKGCELSYFAEKNECDFVVKDVTGQLACAQVTFEMTRENEEREVKGLVEACRALNLKTGFIYTFDDESRLKSQGISIEIVPVWKWLLQSCPITQS